MTEFIEYLQKEWGTIAAAPFTFLLVAVFAIGLAYAAYRWRYGRTEEILRERLAAKDQQLDEYRERLHLTPAHGSEYARLSHAELQKEALKVVANLREWLTARTDQDSLQNQQQWLAMSQATGAEKERLWHQHTTDSMQSSSVTRSEYDSKFKVKAIVLRDEILTRVQHPSPNSPASRMYEHPTNSICMGMIADDLERLARLLR